MDIKERRELGRISISFPIECLTLPERNSIFYTVCKDLSSNGIRILSESFLPEGGNMKININLIDEMAAVKAEVIWCNKEARSHRYYAGLRFMEVSDSNKKHLAHFIDKINNA